MVGNYFFLGGVFMCAPFSLVMGRFFDYSFSSMFNFKER
jgi:hypothetical protein